MEKESLNDYDLEAKANALILSMKIEWLSG